jgi:hypothetical protein
MAVVKAPITEVNAGQLIQCAKNLDHAVCNLREELKGKSRKTIRERLTKNSVELTNRMDCLVDIFSDLIQQ